MLRDKRLEKGLTRAELASKSGVHPVKIAQYEDETLRPENMTLRNALKLADALECDPRDFVRA